MNHAQIQDRIKELRKTKAFVPIRLMSVIKVMKDQSSSLNRSLKSGQRFSLPHCILSLFGKKLVNGAAAPEWLMIYHSTQGNFVMGNPAQTRLGLI